MYPRILHKFDVFLVKSIYKYANRKWYNSPFGNKPKATKKEYLKIFEKTKHKKYQIVDDFELKHSESIDYEWFHNLALHTQVVKKKSDICYVHGRLLYVALKRYILRNNIGNINILETGTARGFSALCMAKSLQDEEVEAKIITFDVIPHNVKMYWNCIDDIEGKKTRAELLENYNNLIERYIIFHQGNTNTELNKLQTPRIHFAFLDGGHDYSHIMNEFNYLNDKQKTNDVIFFDDYTPKMFPGVVKAVDEICQKYKYSKEIISINENRAYLIATKL